MGQKADPRSKKSQAKGTRAPNRSTPRKAGGTLGSRVRDIMQRQVVTIRADATVREAAKLMDREGISGAPVVDESGVVLGVVSASDIVSLVATGPELPVALGLEERPGYFVTPEVPYRWTFREVERRWAAALHGRAVRDIMTPARFAVRPDATILEAARFLARARIHRALVLERGRLRGIVTTMDVLRAVAGVEA